MKKSGMLAAALAVLWGALAFGADVAVTVTNVTAKQRYPWNGMVDIDFELSCSDPETNVTLYATARDTAAGKPLPMRTVKLEGGEFGEVLVVRSRELPGGKGRLVWDAGKDAAGTVSDAVSVEVQAFAGAGPYLVVDLSAGSGDDATYPVSFLGGKPQGGWGDEYKTTKLVLRRVLPGTFTMGSPTNELGHYEQGHFGDEIQHEVTISCPFYIGVFEVTQKQYELVMGSRPSYFSNASCYEKRPVERVSYNAIRGSSAGAGWPASSEVDAASFMGKLRARAVGFAWDLPTEAQWEYACRAGTTTALNSGGNLTGTESSMTMAEVGRYWHNGGKNDYGNRSCDTSAGTAEVGSYLPNAWELYDMHGNVCEWCLDWLASVTATAATDPVGPASGSYRVLRGGSWGSSAWGCRSAHRDWYDEPAFGLSAYGFRLVCVLGQ